MKYTTKESPYIVDTEFGLPTSVIIIIKATQSHHIFTDWRGDEIDDMLQDNISSWEIDEAIESHLEAKNKGFDA